MERLYGSMEGIHGDETHALWSACDNLSLSDFSDFGYFWSPGNCCITTALQLEMYNHVDDARKVRAIMHGHLKVLSDVEKKTR